MIEPPEVPHHHAHQEGLSRPGWLKFVVDAVMPISVLLLSIGSLYVALHTGSAMDKLVAHNEKLVKAQSTPILEYSTSNYDPAAKLRSLSFSVTNVGTGPARLHWLRVVEGEKRHAHFQPWLLSLMDAEERSTLRSAEVITGDVDGAVIPARDGRTALTWARPPESDLLGTKIWDRANIERGKLRVEVCYCSVFDECWEHRFQEGPAKAVAQCTAAPDAAASSVSR
jgi:hypothetical protein